MRSFRVTGYGEPLAILERPTPQPRGTEVLLKVLAAGVCHSDLHMWQGGFDLGTGKLSLRLPLPATLGHETAGEIIAVGPDAHGVRVGERRLVYPWVGCGECAVCRGGAEHVCAKPAILGVQREGGYADHILVPHPRLLLDIGDLDPVAAAPFACSGLTAYSALKKAGASVATEPVAVFGAGGLGLMCLHILRALGGAGAVVVEIDERKRAAARDAGALAVIDGNANDAAAQIVAAAGAPLGAAIDFVGSAATARTAFGALRSGGTLVLVGLFGGTAPWPLPLIALRAITIAGNYVGSLAELHELLELARRGAVAPLPLKRRPLTEVTAALDELRTGTVVGRSVLVP
ncbi:MAG: alcohol dehydrogenase [Candidatus Velthaea sp.]